MTLFAEDLGKIERELEAGFDKWKKGIASPNRKEAEAGHKQVKEGAIRLLNFVEVHRNFLGHAEEHILQVDEFVLQDLAIPDRFACTSLFNQINSDLLEIRSLASNLIEDLTLGSKDDVLRSDAWTRAERWYSGHIKPEIAKLNQLAKEDVLMVQKAVNHVRRSKVRSKELNKAVGDLADLEKKFAKLR